jgi:phosphoribosyl-AMP cyclohydrolase
MVKPAIDRLLTELRFDSQGLIPAIAQDYKGGAVLMLAWMNAEALRVTLDSGWVCYWSRSRRSLWRKGESSGHRQRLVELRYDCDGDSLLLLVEQQGPACHTNRPSCFYSALREGELRIIATPQVEG